MNRFVIANAQNCIGCRTCEVACVVAHRESEGLQGLTPGDFSPRIKVVKIAGVSSVMLCRHCEDAPCAEVCPNGAIVREHDSIQIKQDKCIGCKTCALACPYGVMQIVAKPTRQTLGGLVTRRLLKVEAVKCDLCQGKAEGPNCVRVCPTEALQLVTEDAFNRTMMHRQQQAALDDLL
jgi:electron transport protein HydN